MLKKEELAMNKTLFRWLLAPFLFLVLMSGIIFAERMGVTYEKKRQRVTFLSPQFEEEALEKRKNQRQEHSLILYHGEIPWSISCMENVGKTLDGLCVSYDTLDVNHINHLNLDEYHSVILTFSDMDKMKKILYQISDWVKEGGNAIFAQTLEYSKIFDGFYPKLGINYFVPSFGEQENLHFETNLLPNAKGLTYGDMVLKNKSMTFTLSKKCRLHLVTADEAKIPLLWDVDYGKGKFIVNNSNLMNGKESRGIVTGAFALTKKAFIYPVINASVFYIDDFPAPIPQGYFERITKEYGRSIENFYINVWWPDMIRLKRKYGLSYTAVLIENYDRKVKKPFYDPEDRERFSYLGNLLLRTGGELGLHGYNHVPLGVDSLNYKGLYDYPKWPSDEHMDGALMQVRDFFNSLYPTEKIVTYVPPSNILSEEGYEALRRNLPDLKVIASLYLGGRMGYEQEFEKDENGIIHLPRTISGYLSDEYMDWITLNEIGFHYVNAHFAHPDDILDEDRSRGQKWSEMYRAFEKRVRWIYETAPHIRNLTSEEAAAEIEKYNVLSMERNYEGNRLDVKIDGFSKEAYFLMRLAQGEVESVKGGTAQKIGEDYYLVLAQEPQISLYMTEEIQ